MKTKKRKILEYIAVFQEEKEGGFSVWVPDLPGCASQGETVEEALKNIKEAIELYLEEFQRLQELVEEHLEEIEAITLSKEKRGKGIPLAKIIN